MALMTWSDRFSVGVRAIDDQHAGLVKTLNELHAAMMSGQANSVTGALLKQLLDYTRGHFSAEEKMMADARYPGLAQHRVKHRDLTRQVEGFAERYERGEARLNIELLNFLNDWLTTHILKVDKEYGPWMNEHGVR
jgi:hemerythrin